MLVVSGLAAHRRWHGGAEAPYAWQAATSSPNGPSIDMPAGDAFLTANGQSLLLFYMALVPGQTVYTLDLQSMGLRGRCTAVG